MKILFSLVHPGYLRNFDSTIRLLAERGHSVHLLFKHERKGESVGRALLDEYATRYEIQYEIRTFPGTFWSPWASAIRAVRDYSQYLRPEFRHAVKLRQRAATTVPAVLRWLAAVPGAARFLTSRCGRSVLTWIEAGIPLNPRIVEYLRASGADVLMASPFVDLESPQTEYVKAAQSVRMRTVLPVASWDNLTNKGSVRILPDIVAVWNRLQEREAIDIHGVPPDRIVVSGAEAYDHWFVWRSRPREEFCRRVGLDPAKPYLLYVGSSGFISGDESEFASRWVAKLRSAPDSLLRGTSILFRPHPQNGRCWDGFDASRVEDVVVYPRHGSNPLNADDKQDYFDSIFHAAAVVGINTSALIESAILGRGVFTLLDAQFSDTQAGTLHFHYLIDPRFGFLQVARSFEEHLAQLTAALYPDDRLAGRARTFVETFVRPFGADVPATPILVKAIERLSRRQPASARSPSLSRAASTIPAAATWGISAALAAAGAMRSAQEQFQGMLREQRKRRRIEKKTRARRLKTASK